MSFLENCVADGWLWSITLGVSAMKSMSSKVVLVLAWCVGAVVYLVLVLFIALLSVNVSFHKKLQWRSPMIIISL